MLSPSAETVRLFLHLVAAAVWVGGQVVMAGLVPVLRGLDPGAPGVAARAFASRLAWPSFLVLVVTGIWNVVAVDVSATDTRYAVTLGTKIIVVTAVGFAAWAHGATGNRRVLAATGALSALGSVVALFLGVLLVAHR